MLLHLYIPMVFYCKENMLFKLGFQVYLAQWSRQRGNQPLRGSYVLDLHLSPGHHLVDLNLSVYHHQILNPYKPGEVNEMTFHCDPE